MRSCMKTVCESARVAKILWRSLSEDDQLVSKKVVEGILRMERLVECAYAGGMQLHDDDKEEIKTVCYTIVGAMYEMEGQLPYRPSWWSFNFKEEEIKTVDLDLDLELPYQSQSQSQPQQLISVLVRNIDEVIMKMVSEISNININIVEASAGGDVDVLWRVKEVMLLPRVSRERVVVCIVGESETSSSTALAREVYDDNWFKADMNHAHFAGVSMRRVRMLWALMQHLCPPLGRGIVNNNHTICPLPLPLPDDNVVNPWFEMSMIQYFLKEFPYMLVIDGVKDEAEWEWVDTTARSNWLLITTCSKQVARIIASRYPIVYNIPPENNNIHFPPNTPDSKKDVASAPSTHFLKKMFSIIGKAKGFLKKMFSIIGKGKGKGGVTPLNTITKSFITDIGMRGYYVIEHKRCPICLDNPNDFAFGCGHMTCCDCGKRLELCPICRSELEIKFKIYN